MLKHQKLFVAMEQRIDSGIDLLDEYNASLESLNSAIDALDQLESGNTTAVSDVQKRFGAQLSMEGVSMEAVYVHVNSAQVQAAIDFLKKWIPILLKKIKELTVEFFTWVKGRLLALEERLGSLKERVKASPQKEFEIEVTENLAPYLAVVDGILRQDIHGYFGGGGLTGALNALEGWVVEVAGPDDFIFDQASTYVGSIASWLTFNEMHLDFPTPSRFATTVDEMKEVIHSMPELSKIAAAAKEQLVHAAPSGRTFKLSKASALMRIDALDKAQWSTSSTAQEDMKNLRALGKKLEPLEGDHSASEAARVVIKALNYALKASQAGLQSRLKLLSGSVQLLEKLTAPPAR